MWPYLFSELRVAHSWRWFGWGRSRDTSWITSVSAELFITAKLCECWNDMCVICREGQSFKGRKIQLVSYLTSLLKSVQIPNSLGQGLLIRMRSSKVQYSWDWLFNNKHPCEWKIRKRLKSVLVLRIGCIPVIYEISLIHHYVPSSFHSFPLTPYDSWLLSLYLC